MALVGQLEIGGGLDEAIVPAVKQVLAEGFETLADLLKLVAGFLFGLVGLNEGALQVAVLLLQIGCESLGRQVRAVLSLARRDHGQQPEGCGEVADMTGKEHRKWCGMDG